MCVRSLASYRGRTLLLVLQSWLEVLLLSLHLDEVYKHIPICANQVLLRLYSLLKHVFAIRVSCLEHLVWTHYGALLPVYFLDLLQSLYVFRRDVSISRE